MLFVYLGVSCTFESEQYPPTRRRKNILRRELKHPSDKGTDRKRPRSR